MLGWLQAFVDVNIITRLVTAARCLMHGYATASRVGWVLVWCALRVAAFAGASRFSGVVE